MRWSPILAIGLVLSVSATAAPAPEAALRPAFAQCRALTQDGERLHCYDRLAAILVPPRFQGRLTMQTEPFEITAPTVLRYESDGPIFVLSLKDARGEVVQNLHVGGGGSATHTIAVPGTYSLQVSGSESWRIWLDPAP